MKAVANLTLVLSLSVFAGLEAQQPYPFRDTENNNDIQAYWYNVPGSSYPFPDSKNAFHSLLQIYGKASSDLKHISASVYLKNGVKVLDETFNANNKLLGIKDDSTPFDFEVNDGFFKLGCPVEYLDENPVRIVITLVSSTGKRTKVIECRYHKISGHITDFEGNPEMAYVCFSPDAFGSPFGIWSDSSGYYELEVPERTYNSVIVNTQEYKISKLEAWGWHIIVDRDQRMDYKIGTAEVYSLNLWANNWRGGAYSIAFRPMALVPKAQINSRDTTITMNGNFWKVIRITPELEPEHLNVTINGSVAKIISMQKYYETAQGMALPAYIVQVERGEHSTPGKKTGMVEYENLMEIGGKNVVCNSMGYFEFYNGYYGLSKYF